MPPQMLEMLRPEYVTPGVVFLASEEAPTGVILTAGAGKFSGVEMIETAGINQGMTQLPTRSPRRGRAYRISQLRALRHRRQQVTKIFGRAR